MIAKGKSVGAKTQRERDYLDALGVMYADYEKVDHRTRMLAYAKAMEQLAQRYPKDDEAQIHYALALNTSASPADKTYASQLKGAAILEPIAKRQPQHPGVAHYLIHLYDYPAIAEKGLDAARRYAKIAPAAAACPAHAVAHLHARRLLEANRSPRMPKSARVAKESPGLPRSAARHGLPGLCLSAARAGHKGQGRHRRDDDGHRLHRDIPSGTLCAGRFAGALRDGTRRLEGRRGAPGPAEPAGPRAGDDPFRTRARRGPLGQSGAAKADIAKLAELRDKLRDAKDAYWSEQVDIQPQVATAWVLYAEGKHDDALKAMSAAADAEDKTEKHPVTPGVPKPAREFYGVMLLESGMAKEALAAFEATLKKEPNRLGAYAGAAKAAEKAGDTAKAQEYYKKVLTIAGDADKTRAEVGRCARVPDEEVVRIRRPKQ